MLSGRAKKDYAREAQAVATAPEAPLEAEEPAADATPANGAADEPVEALVAM